MKRLLQRRIVRVATVATVLSVLAGGAAFAAVTNAYTDSSGAYHGCVNTGSGLLRLVVPADTCKPNEAGVQWNQAGPQGPQGPAGPAGPAGKDGVGVTGAAVATGDASCPNGGSKFTDANGNVTYACNGAPGAAVAGMIPRFNEQHFSGAQGFDSVAVTCPTGQRALGGGFFVGDAGVRVIESDSNNDSTTWYFQFYSPGIPGGFSARVQANCADAN